MSAPRIVVVEHESTCPPALFGEWLTEAGCALTVCRPWAGDALPPLDAYDGWLVLGGAMNAYADDVAPWLPEVRARFAQAAADGVPALGICLGHQLAAVGLGGTVEPNLAGQRVGLHDVGWTDAAASDPLVGAVAAPRRAVQWNSDVVTAMPDGAVLLAALGGEDGQGDEVQAARFAPTVWGVQWHPEVDRAVATSWAEGDRDDHLERGIDQEALLASIEQAAAELERAWRPLARSFAGLVRDAG